MGLLSFEIEGMQSRPRKAKSGLLFKTALPGAVLRVLGLVCHGQAGSDEEVCQGTSDWNP